MKILSVLNIVLSIALLAAVVFLASNARRLDGRGDALDAQFAGRNRQLSNEISRAYTRIGRLETRVAEMQREVRTAASRPSSEPSIERKIAETLRTRKISFYFQETELSKVL